MQEDKKEYNAGGQEDRQCRMTRRKTMQDEKKMHEDKSDYKRMETVYSTYVRGEQTENHIWKDFM